MWLILDTKEKLKDLRCIYKQVVLLNVLPLALF